MTEQEAKDIGRLIAEESHIKQEPPEVLAERISQAFINFAAIGDPPAAVSMWWHGLSSASRAELLTAIHTAMTDPGKPDES